MVKFQQPSLIDRNGEIIGHVIQYTRVGSQIVTKETVASGTTHTISGLLAYVDYSVIVATVNINGTGRFSNPIVQRSGQDSESSVIIKYGSSYSRGKHENLWLLNFCASKKPT